MYTNETAIEKYLMTDIDPSQSSQITDWISAVERYINNYCNRPEGFEAPAADETKYFDGPGGVELTLESFTTITSIQTLETDGATISQTLTENDDYWLYPLNETPKYEIRLTPNSACGSWPSGHKRIKIIGKFGYGTTVPKDIELAATILVGKIIEKGKDGGNVQSESLGDYSVSYKPLDEVSGEFGVKKILDPYRIIEL